MPGDKLDETPKETTLSRFDFKTDSGDPNKVFELCNGIWRDANLPPQTNSVTIGLIEAYAVDRCQIDYNKTDDEGNKTNYTTNNQSGHQESYISIPTGENIPNITDITPETPPTTAFDILMSSLFKLNCSLLENPITRIAQVQLIKSNISVAYFVIMDSVNSEGERTRLVISQDGYTYTTYTKDSNTRSMSQSYPQTQPNYNEQLFLNALISFAILIHNSRRNTFGPQPIHYGVE